MATAQIKIKNKRIVGYNDHHFISLSKDGKRYEGNGWTVTIKNGRIICHSEKNYRDGKVTCHREFRLADGLIGLAGGDVRERYAYFRDAVFQKFLEDHKITAVKHEDPNKIFVLRNSRHGCGGCEMKIRTDGMIEVQEVDYGKTEEWERTCPNTCAYEVEEKIKIKNATWAIIDKVQHEHNSHNVSHIIYALEKNVTLLSNIENERKKEKWKNRIEGLIKSFNGSIELMEIESFLKKEFKEDFTPLHNKKQEKLIIKENSATWGSLESNFGKIHIEGTEEEIKKICDIINAAEIKSKEELIEFCKKRNLQVTPTRYYFKCRWWKNYEIFSILYCEGTKNAEKGYYNRFDVDPWPPFKIPKFY